VLYLEFVVAVAQMVRALDCGSRGCEFEARQLPQETEWPSGKALLCKSNNTSSTLVSVSMMAHSQAAKALGFGPSTPRFESWCAIQPFVGV
jgi:hypothetical protein